MQSIVSLVVSLINLYSFVLFVYVLLSWIPTKSGIFAEINNFLAKICDPYLNIFKRFIPPLGGMVDVSPILALIVLQLLQRFIVNYL
ncbi:MAG: YggT family protein [Coriobacteriaceae bacterium]|jgi:YggT family protein|nr:YggT family protein [Coriobacteriaceae bacterium]